MGSRWATEPSTPSAVSRSRSIAARSWASSGRTARASRRPCTRSWGSSDRPPEMCGWTANPLSGDGPKTWRGVALHSSPKGVASLRSSASRRTCDSASQAGALSGGQQQQLAIARALVSDPQVLLLDEPSLGLAPRMVDVVFEVLQEIRDRGIAVLLVEQRAQRTIAVADRSYVLSKGRLRLTLGPEAAEDTETIVAAYFA